MKLIKSHRIIFLLAFILGISLTRAAVLKAHENKPCENSCQVCQKVVYQMKFQQMADCEFGGVCRDTCFKIQQNFNTQWSPFQPFLKDMFGKCEICFRAGYCSISECKEQEMKELEIINKVVNSASITGKVDENLLKNLPEIKNVSAKDIPRTQKTNEKLTVKIADEINKAVKYHNTENLIPKIQSLVKAYFVQPFQATPGGIREILYTANPIKSAADVTFWNQKAQGEVSKSNLKTKDLVKKLDDQVKKLSDVKKTAKKDEINEVKKAAKQTQASVKKIEKKYNKAERKLNKKEEAIKNVITSNANKDPQVTAALGESLKKIQEYKNVVKSVKQDLKKEKQKLKGL